MKPPRAEYVDWACSMALERLGTATPRQIRDFLYALSLDEVRRWCEAQEKDGAILQVSVEGEGDASPRTAFARPDWRRRASRVPELPRRMRLLSPFEPALHDRARTLHLFGFDYRLECFVPAARRVHGYYVLPVLEGDRLVARLDPKLHRDQERLEVRGLWWEPGVKPTATRRKALESAVARFAEQIGAASWTLPRGRQSSSA